MRPYQTACHGVTHEAASVPDPTASAAMTKLTTDEHDHGAKGGAPHGIGTLDAAAAVGVHPFISPARLWTQKTGRSALLQPSPEKEDPATYWTQMFDPIVAAHYSRTTGRRLWRINANVQHAQHSWMFATVEREVIDDPAVQLLSYLFVGPLGARLWSKGMPAHIRLRAMHDLAVTGKQAIDFAVFMCGQLLQIHRVHRDERVIERLVAREEDFWQHVVQDHVPVSRKSALVRLFGAADPIETELPGKKKASRKKIST